MTEWTMTCSGCGASTTSGGALLAVPAREADCTRAATPARDERCPDCGKVPGRWQPTVSARRDELTLEECRTCGAAWTGRIGSRIGRAKP